MSEPSTPRGLPLVPPSFFSIVLGLDGLGGAWRLAHGIWGLPAWVGESLYTAGALSWLTIAVLYALKWVAAPAVAREEANNAIQCCFIGLAGVATMLVGQGAIPYARPLAALLFLAGAIFTLGFGVWRTGLMWQGGRDTAMTTPILYLPLVAGGFVTGTVAAGLGWAAWGKLAFGVGFFCWLAIESVLLHRLYTAAPLALPLRPTLGIQLAPPAVGAVAYLATGGSHLDYLPHMMAGYALLQALILLRMWRWIREQPFTPSYWAFTFGATALASLTLRLTAADPQSPYATLAPLVFALVNLLVLSITVATLKLLFQGRLIPPTTSPIPDKAS